MSEGPVENVSEQAAVCSDLVSEVGKVVVGQEPMVARLVMGLLTGGHVLLEGVPGLAKPLAVRSLARAIDTGFSRIQFTPDMLPADVIGTDPPARSDSGWPAPRGGSRDRLRGDGARGRLRTRGSPVASSCGSSRRGRHGYGCGSRTVGTPGSGNRA